MHVYWKCVHSSYLIIHNVSQFRTCRHCRHRASLHVVGIRGGSSFVSARHASRECLCHVDAGVSPQLAHAPTGRTSSAGASSQDALRHVRSARRLDGAGWSAEADWPKASHGSEVEKDPQGSPTPSHRSGTPAVGQRPPVASTAEWDDKAQKARRPPEAGDAPWSEATPHPWRLPNRGTRCLGRRRWDDPVQRHMDAAKGVDTPSRRTTDVRGARWRQTSWLACYGQPAVRKHLPHTRWIMQESENCSLLNWNWNSPSLRPTLCTPTVWMMK